MELQTLERPADSPVVIQTTETTEGGAPGPATGAQVETAQSEAEQVRSAKLARAALLASPLTEQEKERRAELVREIHTNENTGWRKTGRLLDEAWNEALFRDAAGADENVKWSTWALANFDWKDKRSAYRLRAAWKATQGFPDMHRMSSAAAFELSTVGDREKRLQAWDQACQLQFGDTTVNRDSVIDECRRVMDKPLPKRKGADQPAPGGNGQTPPAGDGSTPPAGDGQTPPAEGGAPTGGGVRADRTEDNDQPITISPANARILRDMLWKDEASLMASLKMLQSEVEQDPNSIKLGMVKCRLYIDGIARQMKADRERREASNRAKLDNAQQQAVNAKVKRDERIKLEGELLKLGTELATATELDLNAAADEEKAKTAYDAVPKKDKAGQTQANTLYRSAAKIHADRTAAREAIVKRMREVEEQISKLPTD